MQGLVGVSIQMALVVGRQGGADRIQIAQVHEVDLEPLLRHDAGEQAIGAAVQVVVDEQVVAGREQHQERRLGGHAGGEGEAEFAAFERGQAVLQGLAGGVAAARVVERTGLVDAFEGEGRGLVDRRHHRAVTGSGPCPA